MSQRLLVLPDLHCAHQKAQKIIDSVPHDRCILLGDTFDQFHDTVQDNVASAEWLVASLARPDRVHCIGNHDTSYRFGHYCSGWTKEKSDAIAPIMKDHWPRLKFYHYEQGFLFTHAGYTWPLFKAIALRHKLSYKYQDCDVETVLKSLELESEVALTEAVNGGYPKLLAAGWDRGGREKHGGVVWGDASSFLPIPNVYQVCGHTPLRKPDRIWITKKAPMSIQRETYDQPVDMTDALSCNWFLDTHLKHYAVIEDGQITVYQS